MSSHISHLSVRQGCDLTSSTEESTMLSAESFSRAVPAAQGTPMFMGGLPLLQPQRSTETESLAIKYEGFHGTYQADPTHASQSSPQRLDGVPVPEPTSQGLSFMVLPPEVRLQIFSYNISNIAGPADTISETSRATIARGKGQTEWQARRGAQQLCSRLRAEALEALYNESTFFVRMSQCEEGEFSFERRRYHRWLKSLGTDEDIRRVRKVTFGVEWPSYNEGGVWHRGKGDVHVRISRDEMIVNRSQRIEECPAAPLEQLRAFIAVLMVGKVIRRGLEQGAGTHEEWLGLSLLRERGSIGDGLESFFERNGKPLPWIGLYSFASEKGIPLASSIIPVYA